ncbi:6-O-methylguanine DNA methyltransferase [Xylariomycetidae sp. FL0641]|nr:6-O-methylguanine DNA methyltransferase [Xylariomycetidae sp. FL0641]
MAAGHKRKRVSAESTDTHDLACRPSKSAKPATPAPAKAADEDAATQLGRIAAASRTPFEKRVLSLLCQIPRGSVSTYAQLAAHLGSSPRAVGNALRRNPLAPLVPCHRVVAADRSLGGFKGFRPRGKGGVVVVVEGTTLEEKRRLLRGEGQLRDDGALTWASSLLLLVSLQRPDWLFRRDEPPKYLSHPGGQLVAHNPSPATRSTHHQAPASHAKPPTSSSDDKRARRPDKKGTQGPTSDGGGGPALIRQVRLGRFCLANATSKESAFCRNSRPLPVLYGSMTVQDRAFGITEQVIPCRLQPGEQLLYQEVPPA